MGSDVLAAITGAIVGGGLSLFGVIYKSHFERIAKLKNTLAIFESFKDDWESFRNEDDINRLTLRIQSLQKNLNDVINSFVSMQDKKITGSYFKLKLNLSKFEIDASSGSRGRWGYHRDDIDLIFNDQYLNQLHNKYCTCNLNLHNL